MRHTCSAALGLLLVMKAFLLLISLPHVFAYNDGEMNRNAIAGKQSFISAHYQKEVVYASNIGTQMEMEQLGGRKIAVPMKLEITQQKPGSHGGAIPQVISGRYDNNYNNIGLGGSEHQHIHQEQKKTTKLEPNIQKNSGILGSPRHDQVLNTNTKTKEFQESKATPTKSSSEGPDNLLIHQFQRLLQHDDYDHSIHSHPKPKAEKHRLLLEATKEIVNLMHKDYKGVERPRRKPPINNHVPIH